MGIHIGCGVGIFILTGFILGFVAKYAEGIYAFFMNRMVGVTLEHSTDEVDSPVLIIKIDGMPIKTRPRSIQQLVLWCFGTITLGVAVMVLFEGCILGNAGVYLGDDCSDDPMTFFASGDDASSTAVGTFECVPGNKTTFPNRTINAWCYGWIVKRQTVSKVINQIGICGGIIGVTGTLFAFMFRTIKAGSRKPWFFIALIELFLIIATIMILVSAISHIAFSVLAYLVVAQIITCLVPTLIFKQDPSNGRGTVLPSTSKPVQIIPVSN